MGWTKEQKISRRQFIKLLFQLSVAASFSFFAIDKIIRNLESIYNANALGNNNDNDKEDDDKDDKDSSTKDMEIGINIAALNNEYGHDLGYNQFSGRQFWSDDKNAWRNFDFKHLDSNFAELNPWITWEGDNLDKEIKKYKDSADIIRVWVFEQHEGLKFSYDKIKDSNIVSGIDKTHLLPNIKRVLDKADSYGIKVYLCLTDGWGVNITHTPKNHSGEKLDKYRQLQHARRKIMKEMVEWPDPFIDEALIPLISAIKNHPALYAIDLMNEPEGMLAASGDPVVNQSSMNNFLSQCSYAIKNTSDNVAVSVGLSNFDSIEEYNASLPKDTLDFYDYHIYSSSTREVKDILSQYDSEKYNGKRLVLGESGYKDRDGKKEKGKKDHSAKEIKVMKSIFTNARKSGFSACLLWDIDFYHPENKPKLLELLKEYKKEDNAKG